MSTAKTTVNQNRRWQMDLMVFDLMNSSPNVSWVPCSFSPSRQKGGGWGGDTKNHKTKQTNKKLHKSPPKPQINEQKNPKKDPSNKQNQST